MPGSQMSRALYYAQKLGWPVVPVYEVKDGCCACSDGKECSRPGEHARTKHGVRDATTDPEQIRAWWGKWPDANIGVATGRISGIIVIDADLRKGARQTAKILLKELGPLSRSVKARSGDVGIHHVEQYPDFKVNSDSNGKLLGPGYDVLSDGTYFIAPSSKHISGKTYEWFEGHSPNELKPARLPDSWLNRLRSRMEPKGCRVRGEGATEGERVNIAHSLAKPATHCSDLARMPAALLPLIEETRWVNWNWEVRADKNGKPEWTKPPRRPRDLTHARSNDRSTWGTYERALRRYKDGDADGIGIMLWDSHISAADLDHCCKRDAETKETVIDPWARKLRAEAGGAYCEVTVSGGGLRLIGTAAGAEVNRPFKIQNAHPKARLELFRNARRFITISGLQLGDCQQLPPFDDFIDKTLASYDRCKEEAEPSRQGADLDYDDLIRNGAPQGDRSELFHSVVWHLANKGWTVEQIVDELARHPNGIGLKYAARLHREVSRSYEKWRRRTRAQRTSLPSIQCIDGQIARMVDEAQAALIKAKVTIFVRGGMLVEPITVERDAADNSKTMVTVFAPLSATKVSYLLNKYAAVFQRYDSKQESLVETDPPPKLTAALLTLKAWQFPEVVGIVGAPTMRPDGSILSKVGYDHATRLWCNCHIQLPPIPEEPTRAQAEAALKLLKDLLSEFPFVSAVDRAVALAAMLSAVLRGAFDLVPLIAILAHDSGTGKSYLVDLIAVLITGRPCPVITGSKSSEEMEKRLGALLLEGSSINSLDNLSYDIQGDLLAQVVTQTPIKIRILGKSEMPECGNRGTFFATGNNIRVVGDMIRRTLVSLLDAKVERPEQRKFKSNPIKCVLEDRGAYIAAALTIARAYLTSTSKVTNVPPLVGFDAWSKFVREPLIWLGEADPVSSMEMARTADPERAAAHELIARWRNCIGVGEPVGAADIIAKASEMKGPGHRFPQFRALLLEHAGGKADQIDPARLGLWLRKQEGRVYGGLRIDIVRHKGKGNEYVLTAIKNEEKD